MKSLFCFIDPLKRPLELHGVEVVYTIVHNDGRQEVGGYASLKTRTLLQKKGVSIEPLSSHINWEEQAKEFCVVDKKGRIVVDLAPHKHILLLPGPAFGDASHPTTRLMLQLMRKYVRGTCVVDIGTGSGILAMSSIRFGAKKAYGIEIDQEACKLAKKNVQLNKMTKKVTITSGHNGLPSQPLCVLCNMIWKEKEGVFEHYAEVINEASFLVLSGTRTEEKNKEKLFLKKRGWKVVETVSERGWWTCAVALATALK